MTSRQVRTWQSDQIKNIKTNTEDLDDYMTYTTRVRLNVNTPLRRVEIERGKSTFPAQNLKLIDVLVTTVVTSVRQTLRILVGEDRAICLHGSTAGQILLCVNIMKRRSWKQHTSEAMSSRPVNCLHVSLSMIFFTSGSISERGA